MALHFIQRVIYEDDPPFNIIWEEDRARRPRHIPERANYFHEYDDVDFIRRFRLSKESALFVLRMIENQLEYPYDCNASVSPINQLLATLRFYATNCHQLTCGDFGGFSKSTAHRIVHRVSSAIASLFPQFVQLPQTAGRQREAQLNFYGIARFPRVIGAIDCTHIRIASPGGNDAELFRNRKNYFSLNVQAVCNAKLQILDLVARWPGRAHDSTIFNNSSCCARFEQNEFENSVLLGDAGYACRSFLLTPMENPQTAAENLYNESHIRTRNAIERMFGVWKRRFPVLALGMRVSLERTLPIITATAVLHNILCKAGEELPPDDPDIALPAPWEELLEQGNMHERIHNHPPRQNAVRQEIINNYFQSLL